MLLKAFFSADVIFLLSHSASSLRPSCFCLCCPPFLKMTPGDLVMVHVERDGAERVYPIIAGGLPLGEVPQPRLCCRFEGRGSGSFFPLPGGPGKISVDKFRH